ncbi:MAG: holo-ACP synthase [Campylobacteraceae bacterium]|nr:holo-ACP synthase [Campylobacteraceae bacterium]
MIGIDIIAIARIKTLYEKHGERALARFLCEDEIKIAKTDETRAGFWAAKEAIAKALGCGIGETCGFHDITIYKDKQGAPHFNLSNHLMEKFKIKSKSLSISHDGGFGIAVAALEQNLSSSNEL